MTHKFIGPCFQSTYVNYLPWAKYLGISSISIDKIPFSYETYSKQIGNPGITQTSVYYISDNDKCTKGKEVENK